MRAVASFVQDAWDAGGPFIGADLAPNCAVIAYPNWFLVGQLGPGSDPTYYGYPRYDPYAGNGFSWLAGIMQATTHTPDPEFDPPDWQFTTEVSDSSNRCEIPNIRTIEIDRSLKQDAATCTITIANWSEAQPAGRTDTLGTRGPMSLEMSLAGTPWSAPPEDWFSNTLQRALHPNTLLRVYLGYGGRDKPWQQAVADGNLYVAGVFLVDEANPTADGALEVRCRDVGKILVEDPVYIDGVPGLPSAQYPYQPCNVDYSDVVRNLLAWAGWLLPDPHDATAVFGNIEISGATDTVGPIPVDTFDKRPYIDGIHAMKDAVGFGFWIDEDGAAHFESPNVWTPGNFDPSGNPTGTILSINEAQQLISYQVTISDRVGGGPIYVSQGDAFSYQVAGAYEFDGLFTNDFDPVSIGSPQQPWMSGGWSGYGGTTGLGSPLNRPKVLSNIAYDNVDERAALIRLLAMYMMFDARIGQVTCPYNPAIQLNDQVRIYEEATRESFVHYVSGVTTRLDMESGELISTLSTNWLGLPDHTFVASGGTRATVPYWAPYVAVQQIVIDYEPGAGSNVIYLY